jgi:type I restriction enzyme M protein
MPSKRGVLAQFSRDELVAAADQFELAVADRRVKDQLVDAVASSKRRASLTSWATSPGTA